MTFLRWGALLLIALTTLACSTEEPAPIVCEGSTTLVDGECQEAPASCTADIVGSIVSQCQEQNRVCYEDELGAICGVCEPGYQELEETCQLVSTCPELDCEAQGRSCIPGSERTDAFCGPCEQGGVEVDGNCVAVTCDAADTRGPAAECAGQFRECVAGNTGAACGDCINGYRERLGLCRPLATCTSLACLDGNRLCEPATASADATCELCRTGFVEQQGSCVFTAGANCDPAPAASSILDGCTAENRSCEPAGGSASCGDCLAGYQLDPDSGRCFAEQTCAQLDCGADNRVCNPDPFARCGDCEDGFVENEVTRECRAAISCSDLSCSNGEICEDATSDKDAFCRVDCPGSAVWNGSRCEPCPPCTAEGETGRNPDPTAAGSCICTTEPGYFYSVGGDVGTVKCDADGDGWVRESARTALESDDPALRDNARCSLRTITDFALVNEKNEEVEVPLAAPLQLYETDRNDDDVVLASIFSSRGIPTFGSTGRRPTAAELNRLTKLCHTPLADYNDNAVPDVEEWAGRSLAPNFRQDQRPFNEYSYFIELSRGAYEAGSGDPLVGRYVIREKQRLGAAAPEVDGIPMVYAPGDDSFWQQCSILRDTEYSTLNPPVGMDFSQFNSTAGWSGMNHHSQFKCLVVDNEPDPGLPQEISQADLASEGYRLSNCGSAGTPVDVSDNPDALPVSCVHTPTAEAQAGDVFWGSVPFIDYDPYGKWPSVTRTAYLRGCVNECAETLPECPFWDTNSSAIDCDYEETGFGEKVSCLASEVCDGEDNDGIGGADDGNPGGGIACRNDGIEFSGLGLETGALSCMSDAACTAPDTFCRGGVCTMVGRCVDGTTSCNSGLRFVECVPNTTPGTVAETCNGIDDDCDGVKDEGNPGGQSQSCTVAGKQGECARGYLDCDQTAGTLTICTQRFSPRAEIGCNNRDDDCDGEVDEPPDDQSCPAPWTRYYKDGDNDTYGDKSDPGLCACAASGIYDVTNQQDCCDSDSDAKPGSEPRNKTSANNCGQWDYNCDGVTTKYISGSSSGGCGNCCSGFCCCDPEPGWASSEAPCGQSASYYINDCSDWSTCGKQTEQRFQWCY